MSELRFTADHEWLRLESDGLVTVGITPFAQDALGDVVYVQLPDKPEYESGAEVAVLESVKAASNIVMPLAGEIVECNAELEGSPELVNASPMQDGWFFRFRPQDADALAGLLDQAAYDRLLNASQDA